MRAACLRVSVHRARLGRAGSHTSVLSTRWSPDRAEGWGGGRGSLKRGLRLREELKLVQSHQVISGEAEANTSSLESWCP